MKHSWLVVALAVALTASCKKGEQEAPKSGDDKNTEKTADNKAAPEAAKPAEPAKPATDTEPAAAGGMPEMAALVQLKVADFDAWKKTFDESVEGRKQGGIAGHHINRPADDESMVNLYLPLADPTKFEDFLTGDELKKTMEKAGVQGPPTITKMKPVLGEGIVFDKPVPGIIVMHEVEDFDAWLNVYKEFDAKRKEMGITGHAVNQAADNPNMVIVYHQANDMDTLKKFVSSEELKGAMGKAGVKGKPDISFNQAVGGSMY